MARPTLVSLARELGVSRQTVSNVINAPHLVKQATRERVQAAIDEAGYRPSAAARALRTQRSGAIAMRLHQVGDGINGAVMDRFLHRVVEQAELLDHRIVLFTAADDAAEVEDLRDLIERHAVDACILTSTSEDDPRAAALTEEGIPFAAFGRPWGDDAATHLWADVDGAAGTREATEILYAKGFQKVGFIGWPVGSASGDDRHRGWVEASAARGVDTDALAVRTDDGVAQGFAAMTHLRGLGCDAVVCASDSLASGAVDVVRVAGQAFFPAIGFDDTPVAQAIGLSSVAQPVEQAATILVRTLIAGLTGGPGVDPALEDLPASAAVGPAGHLLAPSVELRSFQAVDLPQR